MRLPEMQHGGNANENKLRRKEAGTRHGRGRRGKAPLCLLVSTTTEAGKPLWTAQVREVEGVTNSRESREVQDFGSLQVKTANIGKTGREMGK